MHHRAIDIAGQRFGYLTALRYVGSDGKKSKWLVRCDCGVEKVLVAAELRKGSVRSCGCKMGALMIEAKGTHGMSKHPAFAVWSSMLDRCHLPTHQAWRNYGERGITVCEQWRQSFESFWADMGPTYQSGLSLDRINNDGNYTPENCRWATRRIQGNNRRVNRRIETPWGLMTVAEASRHSGIGVTTILYRLDTDCPVTDLFSKPDLRNRFHREAA